jgi:hypothetical protein
VHWCCHPEAWPQKTCNMAVHPMTCTAGSRTQRRGETPRHLAVFCRPTKSIPYHAQLAAAPTGFTNGTRRRERRAMPTVCCMCLFGGMWSPMSLPRRVPQWWQPSL